MLKTAAGGKYLYHYPLFLCAPRTGIREGELVALKGIDVDFNGGFIHVQRNLSRGKITLPKNGNRLAASSGTAFAAMVKAVRQ